jgi:acyl-CoA thioesterase
LTYLPPLDHKASVKKDEGKKQNKKMRGQAKAEKEQNKEFKLNNVLLAYFNDKKELSQNNLCAHLWSSQDYLSEALV